MFAGGCDISMNIKQTNKQTLGRLPLAGVWGKIWEAGSVTGPQPWSCQKVSVLQRRTQWDPPT